MAGNSFLKDSSLPNPVSSPGGVLKYEKERYAHLDQKIVDSLEHRILKKLLAKANIKNGTILNVPCGYGRFTSLIGSFKFKICFFDLHPKMVSRCKEKFSGIGNFFINGSIRALPFKNRSFDLVMNIRFFHHYFDSNDRLSMLRELQRVTKKHVIITYYRNNLFHRIMKKINNKKHRIIMFEKKQFYNELHSAGFKPVKQISPLPFFHAQSFLLLEKI